MKPIGIPLLVLTSLILITVTIFAAMNFPFRWVFTLMIIGEIVLVISVFRILKEKYKTEKTFEDFYEDHPNGREE